MGEIADAMLDGTLCEGCGVFMGEGDGYPVRCRGCGSAAGAQQAGLAAGEHERNKDAARLAKQLGNAVGYPMEYTSHNHGHHIKFGRFYNWYSSGKWYDLRSGVRGTNTKPFIKHVTAQERHQAQMTAAEQRIRAQQNGR